MKTHFSLAALALLILTGCAGPSSTHVVASGSVAVIGEDDYVYYPGSEVYYSPSHLYYYYRDGGAWVHRPQPPRTWVHDAPSVRVHLKDNPERHHPEMVKQYPHNWHPPAKQSNDHHEHDDRDHHDQK